jgi:D-beta-D-heptose 7-phosphate kinase/D-beta-D-heptose 1-phosphate adenosyltransferase
MSILPAKPLDRLQAVAWRASLARAGQRLVFTNGCFDLLHPGHLRLLEEARALGDALLVGINADDSIRRLKGPGRPIVPEAERAEVLAAIRVVSAVTVFAEDTPLELIAAILPDVLVKGADWGEEDIVGRAEVEQHGGRVVRVRLQPGWSTSAIVARAAALDPPPSGDGR